jgi:hypothetical protein
MASTDDFENMLGALRNTEPYFDDAGFSARVISRVATTRRLPGWLANLVLLTFTAVGSALAAWLTPAGSQLTLSVTHAITQAVTAMLAFEGAFFLPTIAAAAAGMLLLACAVIWLSQSDAI